MSLIKENQIKPKIESPKVEGPPEIEELHKRACENGQMFYLDPKTGYKVMTKLSHLKRGQCCGNKCRHCPYNHKNVKEKQKDQMSKTVS